MRRRLGACDAFERAAAEAFGSLRYLLLRRVRDEGGDRRAGAGDQCTEAADDGATKHRLRRQLEVGHGWPHIAQTDVRIPRLRRADLIDAVHELGNPEQAQRKGDDFDAIVELGESEGEPGGAGFDVGADDPDQQPEHRHRDALERGSSRESRSGEQPQQHQGAYLSRTEFECDLHQQRG